MQKAMLDFQVENLGRITYSETAPTRLSTKDLLSPTDCSGNVARLHLAKAKGLVIGTYTGNICTHGTLVTLSKSAAASGYGMLPGDCPLYDWNGDGRWDHINMFAGGDLVYNHGGPGKGPVKQSLAHNVNSAVHVMVRRFIAPVAGVVTHAPVSSATKSNPMHGHSIPALIVRGTGDYFGLISGGNESHGGAYESERPDIELIQEFLNWKYNFGIKVDGIYGPATATAVKAFQSHYMAGTQYYGQVWYDDWAKMASL